MTGIVELITGDHERIRRLFTVLDDAARYAAASDGHGGHPDWMLAAAWARIADLLSLHADTEQKICFLPIFGCVCGGWDGAMHDAIAELDDLREAIAKTRLQEPGSPAWWRAVHAARLSARDHIITIEDDVLPCFRERSDERLNGNLGKQWDRFIAARRRDERPKAKLHGKLSGVSVGMV